MLRSGTVRGAIHPRQQHGRRSLTPRATVSTRPNTRVSRAARRGSVSSRASGNHHVSTSDNTSDSHRADPHERAAPREKFASRKEERASYPRRYGCVRARCMLYMCVCVCVCMCECMCECMWIRARAPMYLCVRWSRCFARRVSTSAINKTMAEGGMF